MEKNFQKISQYYCSNKIRLILLVIALFASLQNSSAQEKRIDLSLGVTRSSIVSNVDQIGNSLAIEYSPFYSLAVGVQYQREITNKIGTTVNVSFLELGSHYTFITPTISEKNYLSYFDIRLLAEGNYNFFKRIFVLGGIYASRTNINSTVSETRYSSRMDIYDSNKAETKNIKNFEFGVSLGLKLRVTQRIELFTRIFRPLNKIILINNDRKLIASAVFGMNVNLYKNEK